MAEIIKIAPKAPIIPARKKVAAYARVSMETDRLEHSLSTQISYYNELIQKNPEWQFVGVYADDGISGTSTERRSEFNRMMEEAEAGKIDIILTKGISRWARNTVDLLESVRHLKELGVEVRFEKENINSLSGDGELMLSILASFAQEESRSISDNVKWGIRKRFENGTPNFRNRILGYRWEDDHLVIVPEEATIVRRIFQNFLEGKSRLETEREFDAEGIRTINGCRFVDSNIKVILTNVTYTGNLLLQKEFISDPITKKRKKNRGELPMYYVEGTHEAIIDQATFDFVQREMARRRELGARANKSLNITCFTGKIKCPYCGCSYMHDSRKSRGNALDYWVCGSKKKKGGRCQVKGSLQELAMKAQLNEVLGMEEFDENLFNEKVDHIEVPDHMTIDIFLNDGTVERRKCKSTARKDCWTKEYREQASKERRSRVQKKKGTTCFTTKIKCGDCGGNYTGQTQRNDSMPGGKVRYYRCRTKGCNGSLSLREDVLREFTAQVMGSEAFNEPLFKKSIDRIEVNGKDLTYIFKDGRSVTREWVPPKRTGHVHSEEEKQRMREFMLNAWNEPGKREKASKTMKELRKERGKEWRRK